MHAEYFGHIIYNMLENMLMWQTNYTYIFLSTCCVIGMQLPIYTFPINADILLSPHTQLAGLDHCTSRPNK